MKVWTNTQFEWHYPVGVVAVAVTKDQAAHMLNDQLEQRGLSRSAKADQFDPVVTSRTAVVILLDGNY